MIHYLKCIMTLIMYRETFIKTSTSHEGLQIKSLTSNYGFTQVINEPFNSLPNVSFCIDLTFISELNIVNHSRVCCSLYKNCHHQTTFAKFDQGIKYQQTYDRFMELLVS